MLLSGGGRHRRKRRRAVAPAPFSDETRCPVAGSDGGRTRFGLVVHDSMKNEGETVALEDSSLFPPLPSVNSKSDVNPSSLGWYAKVGVPSILGSRWWSTAGWFSVSVSGEGDLLEMETPWMGNKKVLEGDSRRGLQITGYKHCD
ncbi:hypothetical protein L2E82_01152 [Cichorium intybus]|uniref:Uncharacterized protein n=1 Tax=Cichorium intybus TaxID=13427 RepID=A0ACB9GZ82_CICIN|nr:hypothetical protein L2E82_01152 [Cichorium intybus]